MVLMGRGRAGHIFRFTDLVGTRRAEPALRQLGRLLDEGESPFPILALLDRKLGQLLVAKEWQLSARRVKGPGLASVLRIPPRAAEETARQANGFEEGELVEAMKGLYQLDRTIKSTGLPARLLLERWILQVCRSPGPARRGFVRDKF
jgi:DNA polymerase III delta subunit